MLKHIRAKNRLTPGEKIIRLSIIVPVFNRPNEICELLLSLSYQTNDNFEVIVVDDGSTVKCDHQVKKYKSRLNIKYFFKENSGPGLSRNYGNERFKGNYSIFLDSDCVLPKHYIQTIYRSLIDNYVDAFGGPDKASKNFSALQKAINYAMTSFLTTGGIRGGEVKLDKFYPRSFNMGYSKDVFEKTKGFSSIRFGEDIDMNILILANGFKTKLIKETFVYQKRRTNFRQFFKQVFNSGIARMNLYKRHPNSLKLVYIFPYLFVLGIFSLILLSILVSHYFLTPLIFYSALIFFDSSFRNRNTYIGLLSIYAAYIQLMGYGSGFLVAFWKRILFLRDEYTAFTENFYE